VDDANLMSELELIPSLTKNCQQLVLIGDDKQMPPVSLSLMAKSKGINVTLFEKLIKQKIKPILFNVQYSRLS
jgi:superfamily I DNA and/or RNA helicase